MREIAVIAGACLAHVTTPNVAIATWTSLFRTPAPEIDIQFLPSYANRKTLITETESIYTVTYNPACTSDLIPAVGHCLIDKYAHKNFTVVDKQSILASPLLIHAKITRHDINAIANSMLCETGCKEHEQCREVYKIAPPLCADLRPTPKKQSMKEFIAFVIITILLIITAILIGIIKKKKIKRIYTTLMQPDTEYADDNHIEKNEETPL